MVSGTSVKKKDVTVLEIGRPFSPTMFEGVLRKFTPDVPSSLSSRPRSVLLTHHLVSFLDMAFVAQFSYSYLMIFCQELGS